MNPVPSANLAGGFFVGLDRTTHAHRFERVCISVNRLRERKSDFEVGEWIMDSGAFTEISTHGRYREGPEEYAAQIRRWSRCGRLLAAITQDYMCEPFILEKTGLTVADHQRLTIERYDALLAQSLPVYLMPVLQGFRPEEYVAHLRQYGERLRPGMWVGVGSICKRNSSPGEIEAVLAAIHAARPDLRLHGFGVKLTSLRSGVVRSLLWTADSMAWSFSARKQGRNAHDWREADRFVRRVQEQEYQPPLFIH